MTRRSILQSLAAAPAAVSAQLPGASTKPPVCIFSKHMAQFNWDDLGKNAKQIGFDGVDLTVRPKGHVEPERAAEDLPKAVAAIRAHGLSVSMITTGLLNADEPAARPTLSTASKQRIPYWKSGYYRYKFDRPINQVLEDVRKQTASLVALSKEYGVTCGFHNHSGDYVGSAVWDTRDIIGAMDPKAIGYYFDPGHATIEGGLGGWRISLATVTPRLKMVALKDFYWKKERDGKWKVNWCPMGEGMVDWPKFFAAFAASKFTGPLTLHVEYQTKDEMAAIAKDYAYIRKLVDASYRSA
jgi:sugar phosphate isomerase/epimerase